MAMERQPSKPRSKWRVGLLVITTVSGGLTLGAALGFLAENKPFEERPTSRLIRDLRRTDSPLDRLRQKVWPVLPNVITEKLSHFTPMSADVVRQLAAVELRRRAPAGAEAVPALVRALSDPHNGVRGMALQALAGFGAAGAAAVPHVLPMLDMPGNAVLRSEAARTLIAIAPDEPRVRARLLSILRDHSARGDAPAGNSRKANASEEALRSAVVRIVDKLSRPDNDVVPLLLSELSQADLPDAVEIIGTLQRIGPITPEIIPTLIQKLNGARLSQQRDDLIAAILRALQRLARTDNEAVPLLITTLREADPSMAARIVQTLGLIGPLTREVIPTIVSYLSVDNPSLQLSAIRALGIMGAKSALAVPEMVRLLDTQRIALTNEPSSSGVDERVGLSVWPAPEPDWEDALPPRMRMRPMRVMRGPETLALQLMRSLARIGPAARDAIPTLVNLMSEVKNELRYEIALTLWQVEPMNSGAKTVLIEGLNMPGPEFPRRLIRHFKNMGADELPILNAAVDHLDEEVRMAAFNAVSTLASEAEPALLTLERIADDWTHPLQGRAARTVESIQFRAAKGSNLTDTSQAAKE